MIIFWLGSVLGVRGGTGKNDFTNTLPIYSSGPRIHLSPISQVICPV